MSVTGERDGRPGGGPQKVGVPDRRPDDRHVRGGLGAGRAGAAQRDRHGRVPSTSRMLDVQVAHARQPGDELPRLGQGAQAQRQCASQHPAAGRVRLRRRRRDPRRSATTASSPSCARCSASAEWVARRALRDQCRSACATSASCRRCCATIRRVGARTRSIAALDAAGVPCGADQHVADVFEDPQVKARGMLQHVPHPSGVDVPQVVKADALRRSAAADAGGAAAARASTATTILAELGYAAADIAALRAAGAI